MDGSNPSHKLQLSIILYGKAIKEKGNSERSLLNQELNPMEPILTELNWFPRLSGGSLEGLTRGGIRVGTLAGRPCTPGHLSITVSGPGWPDAAVRMSLGEQAERTTWKIELRHFWSRVHMNMWFMVHENECIPTSPSPSSTCYMKFCPSFLYRSLDLSVSLRLCHHPSPTTSTCPLLVLK